MYQEMNGEMNEPKTIRDKLSFSLNSSVMIFHVWVFTNFTEGRTIIICLNKSFCNTCIILSLIYII